ARIVADGNGTPVKLPLQFIGLVEIVGDERKNAAVALAVYLKRVAELAANAKNRVVSLIRARVVRLQFHHRTRIYGRLCFRPVLAVASSPPHSHLPANDPKNRYAIKTPRKPMERSIAVRGLGWRGHLCMAAGLTFYHIRNGYDRLSLVFHRA